MNRSLVTTRPHKGAVNSFKLLSFLCATAAVNVDIFSLILCTFKVLLSVAINIETTFCFVKMIISTFFKLWWEFCIHRTSGHLISIHEWHFVCRFFGVSCGSLLLLVVPEHYLHYIGRTHQLKSCFDVYILRFYFYLFIFVQSSMALSGGGWLWYLGELKSNTYKYLDK